MPNYLGLDVGTTTVTAVVVDCQNGDVVGKATSANDSETTSAKEKQLGRSEWNVGRILDVVRDVLRDVTRTGSDIGAIGVTGQMHGMLLVDDEGRPEGPFIGWQDQRAAEQLPGGEATVIAGLIEAVDESDPKGYVCRPKTGYLGATLAWLKAHHRLPEGTRATFLPDFISSQLTSTQPVTDATNAAGSGFFNVVNRAWHSPLIDQLGLRGSRLPNVVESGSSAGSLVDAWTFGRLDTGIPVCVACGDNQASFLGSVRDPQASVLINVGTGGQVSVNTDKPDVGPGLEARPHVDGRYILVGAGLVGGRTYAWLRDFYLEVGRQLFDYEGDSEAVYERMTDLADQADVGSSGLMMEPLLTGTREDPARRGTIGGIGTVNFSPGNLSRALLEGVIAQFKRLYDTTLVAGAGERSVLIGAGNGVRKNKVLREVAERVFGLEMRVPVHTEEAAYGAAMQAMVLDGGRRNLEDAAEIITYA